MKETKIITVLNNKGGVGKTTACLNISTILQEKGYKVLMVDLDSQATLTLSVGLNSTDLDNSIVDIFNVSSNISECIYELDNLNSLCLIPSNPYLSGVELDIIGKLGRENILRKAFNQIDGVFDYIILDCPPVLNIVTINALTTSRFLLIPTDSSPITLFNLDKLIEVASDVKNELNQRLEIIGVIVNFFDSRVNLDKEVLTVLEQDFEVLGVLRRTVKAKQGVSKGLPVVVTHSKSEISETYREITDRIIEITRGFGGVEEVC